MRIAAAAAIVAAAAIPAAGQKPSVGDVASQLSGTWIMNRALSPAFTPGRSNGGRGGGTAYAVAGTSFQRGGRGSSGGGGDALPSSSADLTPEELADRTAIRQMQQVAAKIMIAATAERFSLTDERGEQACTVTGKNEKTQMFGVAVGVKCRWDKDKLRQEFSTTRSKLIRTWGLDDSGRLVLKGKVEGIGQNSPEATAVFDRAER
jgi:hypothetical protein